MSLITLGPWNVIFYEKGCKQRSASANDEEVPLRKLVVHPWIGAPAQDSKQLICIDSSAKVLSGDCCQSSQVAAVIDTCVKPQAVY